MVVGREIEDQREYRTNYSFCFGNPLVGLGREYICIYSIFRIKFYMYINYMYILSINAYIYV